MKSSTSRRRSSPPEVTISFSISNYKLKSRSRISLLAGWDAIANLAMNTLDNLEANTKKHEATFTHIKTQTLIPFKET